MALTSGAVNYNGASIREVADDVMVHGEGPFWDSENNVLYFVDISQQRVYRFFENRLEHVQLGRHLYITKSICFLFYRMFDLLKYISYFNRIILDADVSFVIPVHGQQGLFVIGLGTTLASLRWNLNENTNRVVKLTTVDNNKPGNRWNDAKADTNGYLWAGK